MLPKFSPATTQLLIDTASTDPALAAESQTKFAKALETPLREGILPGDIHSGIFEVIDAQGNTTVEFPLHFLSPGSEGDFVGYTVPTYGSIPKRHIEGDYVNIPVVDIAGSIDWDRKYSRNAQWNVLDAALMNLRMQMVKKKNDMAWHTIISAAADRGVVVADSDAAQGQFTTRLVSLMKTVMRRNGGGNSSSVNRSRLTDLYVSPEAMEDMRSWNVDVVDELTRREIFTAADGTINRIFSVNLHDLDELGEGQEYELFLENTLGVTLPTTGGHTDVEVCVGLDQSRSYSFVSPVDEQLTIVPDNTRVRHREIAYVAWESIGFAVLDARACLLASF